MGPITAGRDGTSESQPFLSALALLAWSLATRKLCTREKSSPAAFLADIL